MLVFATVEYAWVSRYASVERNINDIELVLSGDILPHLEKYFKSEAEFYRAFLNCDLMPSDDVGITNYYNIHVKEKSASKGVFKVSIEEEPELFSDNKPDKMEIEIYIPEKRAIIKRASKDKFFADDVMRAFKNSGYEVITHYR